MVTLRWRSWRRDQRVNQCRHRWTPSGAMRWWEWGITSAVFLPGEPDPALPRRNTRPLRLSDIRENIKPVFFQMVGKTEELWQIQNTQETRQANAVPGSCWQPGPERKEMLSGHLVASEWSLWIGWWYCIHPDFLICRVVWWLCGECPRLGEIHTGVFASNTTSCLQFSFKRFWKRLSKNGYT